MSSEVETKTTVTKNSILTIQKITEHVRKLSPRSKIAIGCYATIAFAHNIYSNYNVGKTALNKYRERLDEFYVEDRVVDCHVTYSDEHNAVKDALSEGIVKRFFSSMFFPVVYAKDVFPTVIIALNQKSNP
jgi:hypothetical protein